MQEARSVTRLPAPHPPPRVPPPPRVRPRRVTEEELAGVRTRVAAAPQSHIATSYHATALAAGNPHHPCPRSAPGTPTEPSALRRSASPPPPSPRVIYPQVYAIPRLPAPGTVPTAPTNTSLNPQALSYRLLRPSDGADGRPIAPPTAPPHQRQRHLTCASPPAAPSTSLPSKNASPPDAQVPPRSLTPPLPSRHGRTARPTEHLQRVGPSPPETDM